eukprot:scpid102546/ scgid3960/ 
MQTRENLTQYHHESCTITIRFSATIYCACLHLLNRKSRNYITRTIGEWYHGKFPYYGRAFHPTAEQTAALFREGERAMSAPAVQQFVEDLGKTTHSMAILELCLLRLQSALDESHSRS